MLKNNSTRVFLLMAVIVISAPLFAFSQKVGFISSDLIRQKFQEAAIADQRVNSFIEEWARELESFDKKISNAEFEIQKNRLVWSDEEKTRKDQELEALRRERDTYKKLKYKPDGEYDGLVKSILKPVDEKIYAAIQQVAADEGYDLILDKSVQPIPYNNYKYDLTLKILKKLGVSTDSLEKELKDKIDKDPRNAKKESQIDPNQRKRTRTVKNTQESNTPDTPLKSNNTTPTNSSTPSTPSPVDSVKQDSKSIDSTKTNPNK